MLGQDEEYYGDPWQDWYYDVYDPGFGDVGPVYEPETVDVGPPAESGASIWDYFDPFDPSTWFDESGNPIVTDYQGEAGYETMPLTMQEEIPFPDIPAFDPSAIPGYLDNWTPPDLLAEALADPNSAINKDLASGMIMTDAEMKEVIDDIFGQNYLQNFVDPQTEKSLLDKILKTGAGVAGGFAGGASGGMGGGSVQSGWKSTGGQPGQTLDPRTGQPYINPYTGQPYQTQSAGFGGGGMNIALILGLGLLGVLALQGGFKK